MSIKSVHCIFLGSIWFKHETKPSHNHPLDLLLLCVTQSSHIPSEPQIFPSKGAGGWRQPPPLIPSPVSREQTCKGCTHCNGLRTSPPSYHGQQGAGERWHYSSPQPGPGHTHALRWHTWSLWEDRTLAQVCAEQATGSGQGHGGALPVGFSTPCPAQLCPRLQLLQIQSCPGSLPVRTPL